VSAIPYPAPADAATSKRMSRNRKRDTRPERAVRSALHVRGLRFRVDHRLRLPELAVRPDIVFTRVRLAVFIDGCFWHACPEHGTAPTRNVEYWAPKLRRNAERDRRVDRALAEAGWIVLRAWEHEDVDNVVDRVLAALDSAGSGERLGPDLQHGVDDHGLLCRDVLPVAGEAKPV
jgi:DNA mismatch endonuclease (patch repair protein)